MSKHVDDLILKSIDIPREKFIIEYMLESDKLKKQITELEKENAILKKALTLYVDWADECGVAWDNFPDMTEKWYKVVEEKGLGWIEGLIFMVTEEAKEQLNYSNQKE